MTEVDPGLRTDPRWQLIERITASAPFQKSIRQGELLRFMAERTLHGKPEDLSEHCIGSTVFGKPLNYSVVEDSSVRVHVRQLRLKLHEYFDGEGRSETCIVEIPKGSYTTLFKTVEQRPKADQAPEKTQRALQSVLRLLPWCLAALFFITTTLAVWLRHPAEAAAAPPPWPMAPLFSSSGAPVQIVVADINYGMMRLVDERSMTLEQYLSPAYRSGTGIVSSHPTPRETRMIKYLSASLLTSYADLVVATQLVRLSGNSNASLVIRSARELNPRDLEGGNFIFIGSPSSNPWVSYFQDRLTFQEREGVVGDSLKYFANLHPQQGEQEAYRGLPFTGSSGWDYATVSLLPLPSGRGTVLILQGLQQEGTEAAGLFLADSANRKKLQETLGISDSSKPVYFEALLRVNAVAGAPNTTTIVATRVIHP